MGSFEKAFPRRAQPVGIARFIGVRKVPTYPSQDHGCGPEEILNLIIVTPRPSWIQYSVAYRAFIKALSADAVDSRVCHPWVSSYLLPQRCSIRREKNDLKFLIPLSFEESHWRRLARPATRVRLAALSLTPLRLCWHAPIQFYVVHFVVPSTPLKIGGWTMAPPTERLL
jgi:hypothetical protein